MNNLFLNKMEDLYDRVFVELVSKGIVVPAGDNYDDPHVLEQIRSNEGHRLDNLYYRELRSKIARAKISKRLFTVLTSDCPILSSAVGQILKSYIMYCKMSKDGNPLIISKLESTYHEHQTRPRPHSRIFELVNDLMDLMSQAQPNITLGTIIGEINGLQTNN
jgi:hypothetical protein